MFNYYLKSRDKNEIQKRVDYLVKVLEKEVNTLFNIIIYLISQFNIIDINKSINTTIINENEKKKKAADDLMQIDDMPGKFPKLDN